MSVHAWVRPAARSAVHRALWYGIGAIGTLRRLRLRREDRPPPPVRSVVIVRIDLLGDLLFTIPLVESLRRAYPNALLTLVTLPFTAELARNYGLADRVLALDSNMVRTPRGLLDPRTWRSYLQIVRELRNPRPDLAVSVAGRTASLVTLLTGARRVIGYEDEAYPSSLTDGLPGGRYGERMHEVEYVRRLARHAGGHNVPDTLRAHVSERDALSVDRKLRDHGISAGDRLVVIHAGSTNGTAKRWPSRQWAAFSDALQQETGARVVLAGAASDRPIAEAVANAAQRPPASLVGETTIGELSALLARADLVASGDSGPLHLAVALGRPLVAVYGPTDPKIHGPYNPSAPVRVHRVDLPCSPCYSMAGMAECPLGDPTCMRLIPVEDVVRSGVELLDYSPRLRTKA